MDKIDFQEKVLGGIFGGIAIIAAIPMITPSIVSRERNLCAQIL